LFGKLKVAGKLLTKASVVTTVAKKLGSQKEPTYLHVSVHDEFAYPVTH
jgi:hypothetical protein